MLAAGVFLDPLLANNYLKNAVDPHDTSLRRRARDMSDAMYSSVMQADRLPTDQLAERRPFSPQLLRLCFFETLLSTAILISHDESGRTQPTAQTLDKADSRLTEFVRSVGVGAMYNLYFLIAGHDMFQPLIFHKEIEELELLSGIRHHPYFPENLDLFLLIGLAMQSLRLKRNGRERTVQLTRVGVATYADARAILRESGYFNKRVQFAYLYQFDTVEDWDEMCDIVWPDSVRQRGDYLNFLGCLRGKRVLEVACGTGAVTFDARLFERVGEAGRVDAIDISTGMLDQARRKWESVGSPKQVQFHLGSVENMPFPDAAYDVCLGVGFLHFTDPVRTLREMARTVVPGGLVSIYQGTRFDLSAPFFREWFEPIYALARRRNAEQPQNYMPADKDTLLSWFRQAGLKNLKVDEEHLKWLFDNPEIVVQHIVRGVSFFESELMELPWDDRKAIVSELIDRGRDVCARYPLKQRIIKLPMYLIKGSVG